MQQGDSCTAVRWLDRACRLLPRDATLKLLLATACATADPPRAGRLFAELSIEHDTPEIRAGLALQSPRPAVAEKRNDGRRRTEGFVQLDGDTLSGWAWHPDQPERDPELTIVSRAGRSFRITATEPADPLSGSLLARPRAFRTTLAPSPCGRGKGERSKRQIRVLGPDGRDLLGSPLYRGCETRRIRLGSSAKPPQTTPPPRRADVIVPVHEGGDLAIACIASVLRDLPSGARLVLVDDGTRDRTLRTHLSGFAGDPRILLVRHRNQRGFPSAANAGLRACAPNDAVLLNSDTLVPLHWLERLRRAAYSAPDIGTVTPFSNSASILSYPGSAAENPVPDQSETDRLAALAYRANAASVADIPVAVGFCMYLRRDCLDAVGRFRTDLFAQGYGEENDLCLRASRLGWRHVAAPSVFVAHHGGRSFGLGGQSLRQRNQAILDRIYPSYEALIATWAAKDPLAKARYRFDLARFRAGRREHGSVVLITHSDGGGVERCVNAACTAHEAAGFRPIVLRPDPAKPGLVAVADGSARLYPSLRFRLPRQSSALLRLLRAERPVKAEIHNLLGHHASIADVIAALGVPYAAYVHDHGWFCPRVVLIGADGRYCGEPGLAGCEACIATSGSAFEEVTSVAAFRASSSRILGSAARVIAPSLDAANRLRRYFPELRPEIAPNEPGLAMTPAAAIVRAGGVRRVCVIGAMGMAKGYATLLDCARDAAARRLPLEFIVAGTTIDDRPLLATGHAFVTGPFLPANAEQLIRQQRAELAWLPSISPETWCFALSEAWRSGLKAVVFDLGAQAERVRRTGQGFVLPLGLPPVRINDTLLAVSSP